MMGEISMRREMSGALSKPEFLRKSESDGAATPQLVRGAPMQKSTALAIGLQTTARGVLQSVRFDCDVTEAAGTAEAVELLKSQQFQVIFLDAEAPGLTASDLDQLR